MRSTSRTRGRCESAESDARTVGVETRALAIRLRPPGRRARAIWASCVTALKKNDQVFERRAPLTADVSDGTCHAAAASSPCRCAERRTRRTSSRRPALGPDGTVGATRLPARVRAVHERGGEAFPRDRGSDRLGGGRGRRRGLAEGHRFLPGWLRMRARAPFGAGGEGRRGGRGGVRRRDGDAADGSSLGDQLREVRAHAFEKRVERLRALRNRAQGGLPRRRHVGRGRYVGQARDEKRGPSRSRRWRAPRARRIRARRASR